MRPDRARALSRRGTRMVIDLANDYAYSALYSGGGKGGRPQLSSGGEVAYTRPHSSAAGWSMESPEREELSGALLRLTGRRILIPYKKFPTPAHRRKRA